MKNAQEFMLHLSKVKSRITGFQFQNKEFFSMTQTVKEVN
jgi:hypothetical protein